MKAEPVKLVNGKGYVACDKDDATHLTLNIPGPSGVLTLPVIIRGARKGTPCWSWNGDTENPTLKPSVKTTAHHFTCHSFITDGRIQFLADCTHSLAGSTVDLLDIDS